MRRKTGLILLMALLVQLFLMIRVHSIARNGSNRLQLKSGVVRPENGAWGDNFTFEVTYIDEENKAPAQGYPCVHLDNSSKEMTEKDPGNVNFSDGKKYEYIWKPRSDYIGKHRFHFCVQKTDGENARYPETGRINGPTVGKKTSILKLNLTERDDKMVFSGVLKCQKEDKGLSHENIQIYIILEKENNKLGHVETGENGRFSISIPYPEERGIYIYKAKFDDTEVFKGIYSNNVFLLTLNDLYVISITFGFFLAILFSLGYLLSRNINFHIFVLPMVLGSFFGVAILPFFSFFSVLIGGIVTGYLVAKEGIKDWINQMKIGSLGGFLAYANYVILTLISVLVQRGGLLFQHSYTQSVFLQNLLVKFLPSSILFVIFMGLGVLIGGRLRGLLR